MNIWCLDFETFFSDDYTLKKLTTEEYIRDPRFEALMLAVRNPRGETFWVAQEKIATFLAQIDWSQDAILCHHAHFDGLILSHHFGVRPRMWFDTLSMARFVLGNHLSVALGALAKHYDLADKSVPYDLFKGHRWADIMDSLRVELGAGACHDVALTWDIFSRLTQGFPEEEYAVIDATVRMFTEPVLVGDAQALEAVQQEEQNRKYMLLNKLGVTEQHLQSADTFVKILENLGVEVEYKEGKNGPIPAIAKTDDFMKSLEAHPDETIATLAAARLEVRSTLDQTRAGRLLGMARRGALPVYLSYCLRGDAEIIVADEEGARYSRLDTLKPWERVWDGVEFVAHSGLVAQGEREVIEWCGVVATPDHVSWDNSGARTTIGRAKSEGVRLMGAALPEYADWLMAYRGSRRVQETDEGAWSLRLRQSRVATDSESRAGEEHWLQELREVISPDKKDQQKPWQSLEQHTAAMHEPSASSLAQVRRKGHTEQIPHAQSVHRVYSNGVSERGVSCAGSGPDRQQWALRAGEHTLGDESRAMPEYGSVQGEACQIAAVFDIYLCGPRNRFVANGIVVSNCGAHTTRWSGGDRVNLQNLPRGGAIRKAISAPEGCLLGVVDASQIECRILNYVAGQHDVLEAFRQKRDLYCENASRFYGREITKADKLERGLGKTLELGCGYGLGWQRLQAQCHLGAMGSPPVDLTEEEARRGIDVYRNSHSMVTGLWKEAEMVLRVLADKGWMTWRCNLIAKDGRLYGPNGTWLNYTTLEWDAESRNYRLKTRKGWSKYYGAKLVENVIQYLARIVMSQAMLRIIRNGYRVATTTHDELVVIIPDDGQSEAHLKYLEAELALTPSWMPGIPLAAEGSVSKRYEK